MVNNYITYLSGGLSGIIEIFFIYPIEYYKTIRQLGTKISLSDFIIQKKKKGIKGIYKGLLPRFFGIIPIRTVFWGTLNTTENFLDKTNINKSYIPAIAGISAGLTQTIIDCPIESIKTKMMIHDNIQKINILKNINFNGFIPNLSRNVFFAMIFNTNKNKLNCIVDKNIYNDVITGSFCGITASILTQPFDYIKTKKQMYGNNINIKKIMYETNYKQYWRGGGTRALINCLSMSVGLPIFNFINYNIFNNK